MIRKLLEIKNLGIFDNYRWDPSMANFERFNLIYGWNGSGKTTLSQLFSSFENGNVDGFPDLKYKIETDEGEFTQGTSYTKKIRVFNQQYISQNIDMLSCKASPIYILGEENRKLAESIRKDEISLRGNPDVPNDFGKIKELSLKKKERAQKENERGDLFTSVAKIIGSNIIGVLARDYRKNNAEKDFELLGSKMLLSPKEKEINLSTLKQQEMGILDILSKDNIEEDAKNLISDAKNLFNRTVEVIAIARLQENPNISQWVEQGLKLHQHENSKKCEFCDQLLPEDRIRVLAAHFNAADKIMKEDIDTLVKRFEDLQQSIQDTKVLDKANLFTEFQQEYSLKNNKFESAKQYLINSILQIIKETENKKLHTTESQDLIGSINIESYIASIETLNDCIKKHNGKSINFSKAKKDAQEKLKKHYLSEIYDKVQALKKDIEKLDKEIGVLENGNPDNPDDIGIKRLQARINENKNKISQSGLACDEINKQLETFLGRKELVFENSEEGYLLKRNGLLAKNLSEGEKTAIAFVYFTIHLKDRDFNLQNDIIVVDDPISSLDSNSLFQAFSFLKNSVQECSQVFILTHNYDFLQLILNWLQNIPRSVGHKAYYMIKNLICDSKRIAKLDVLDRLLINYPNEYQYLFKTLYSFSPDGTIESVYNLPNIARKVLDNFLMIMIPDNSSPYQKLGKINFDENKKTAIYKFTNDQSHTTGKGFDPSLPSEAQNVISYLLEMMKTVFPAHYEILENYTKKIDEL
ncbi:MAG: AAA family ATPase [Pelolinea sp.]|jgi:wobble nucleotide-excising tRNase|nr:AAA family ATPase [Pelolinea sp.]